MLVSQEFHFNLTTVCFVIEREAENSISVTMLKVIKRREERRTRHISSRHDTFRASFHLPHFTVL